MFISFFFATSLIFLVCCGCVVLFILTIASKEEDIYTTFVNLCCTQVCFFHFVFSFHLYICISLYVCTEKEKNKIISYHFLFFCGERDKNANYLQKKTPKTRWRNQQISLSIYVCIYMYERADQQTNKISERVNKNSENI